MDHAKRRARPGHHTRHRPPGSESRMSTLVDKVIVLTGGASGLGRACAAEFAAQGAKLIVGDTDLDGAGDTVAGMGDNGRAMICDVSRSSDCEALMNAAVSAFGRIDGVMSNAGIEGNGTVETC